MEAEAARKKLTGQHDRIRARLRTCHRLAQGLLGGDPVHAELDAAVAQLRADLGEHNATETAMIRPLLHDSPGWGSVLLDRMLEEHLAEHAAFWELLSGPVGEVAARMGELVEELDAHMAAEERTFLNPTVLRTDAIARHRRHDPH